VVKKTLQQSLVTILFICSLRSGIEAQTLDQRAGELSQQIARNMETGQKRRIAVLEFTDLQGQVTNFGRYLSEELITRLYDSNKFKVVERQLLNKVIAEQKLSLTGVVDPYSAKRLGSVLGVDAIVSGTIADRGDTLKINARLIDTETGEVFSAAATEMAKDKEVLALLGTGVTETEADSPSGNAERLGSRKVTSDDFTFELQGCRRSSQYISCEFSIRNNASEDRVINLYANNYNNSVKSSRVIDSNGNELYPSASSLGSTVGDARRLWLKLSLVPQVSTKASLTFVDPAAKVKSIRLLRITFEREGKPWLPRTPPYDYADFKNIPVQ
jgi:TolB-like protein